MVLNLFKCSFSGFIPLFGNQSSLAILSLFGNKLDGTLPQSISQLLSLAVLDISDNLLTGPIPPLPKTLSVAALHRNDFTKLPSLQNLSLCVLTIFDNRIMNRAPLILPPMVACAHHVSVIKSNGSLHDFERDCDPDCNVTVTQTVTTGMKIELVDNIQTPVLYAHSNRLSCSVRCQESNMSNLLIAAGNQLSFDKQVCPSISSASMAGAKFMWTQKLDLVFIIVGSIGLAFLVLVGSGVMILNKKVELTVFEQGMLATCRVLAPVSFLAIVLGVCFWSGPHLYECGDHLQRFTIAYLDTGLTRWAAVATFFITAANIYSVHQFSQLVDNTYSQQGPANGTETTINGLDGDAASARSSLPRIVASMIAWVVFVVPLLSAVPFLNTLAEYVPSDYPLYPVANKIHTYIGVLMWLISIVLTPSVARKLVGSNASQTAVQMIIYGRLVINQVTTVVATYFFHQDCQAMWLRLFFEPCLDRSPGWCFWCDPANTSRTFSVAGHIELGRKTVYLGPGVSREEDILIPPTPINVTTHLDICQPPTMRAGYCSRAIMRNLSSLLVPKLLITAFVAPCVYLVVCLPWCVRIRNSVIRCVQCFRWTCFECCLPRATETKETEIDSELISSVMILEMAIIMGFASPPVVLLCFCTMLTHLAVFHFSRVRLNARFINEARPCCSYLIVSLVLSNVLTVSYFWDNRKDTEGVATFVLVSCTGLVIVYVGWLILERCPRLSIQSGLRAPLLDVERLLDSDSECVLASENNIARDSAILPSMEHAQHMDLPYCNAALAGHNQLVKVAGSDALKPNSNAGGQSAGNASHTTLQLDAALLDRQDNPQNQKVHHIMRLFVVG